MIGDVALEANAIDHEMSNQKQKNISSLTRQKAGMLWKTGAYLQLFSFIFGIWATSLEDHFLTMVAGCCSKVVILAQTSNG